MTSATRPSISLEVASKRREQGPQPGVCLSERVVAIVLVMLLLVCKEDELW